MCVCVGLRTGTICSLHCSEAFQCEKEQSMLKKWLSISICSVFPYLNHILKDTTNVQLNEINSVQGLALGINTNALSVLLIIQVAVHLE